MRAYFFLAALILSETETEASDGDGSSNDTEDDVVLCPLKLLLLLLLPLPNFRKKFPIPVDMLFASSSNWNMIFLMEIRFFAGMFLKEGTFGSQLFIISPLN